MNFKNIPQQTSAFSLSGDEGQCNLFILCACLLNADSESNNDDVSYEGRGFDGIDGNDHGRRRWEMSSLRLC